ncbi:MAG TPA: ribonuclease P protein component [Bacteroidales bacterium]|nr:ribonuclease P protein component [Bacteroidales bacterium]
MQSFKKSERLRLTRLKELLFEQGHVFFEYPFKVFFLCSRRMNPQVFPTLKNLSICNQDNVKKVEGLSGLRNTKLNASFEENPFPAQLLISIPKKKIKKAAERNHLKRLVKESYRRNKGDFYSFLDKEGLFCLLAFIYVGRQILSYHELESKIIVILQRLSREVTDSKIAERAIR